MHTFACIPNFSEGRNEATVESIVGAISGSGARVMDWSMDADHHRSVVAFFGDASTVCSAVFAAASKAVDLIDLQAHKGEHPRFGAIDVVPVVPLGSSTFEEAIALSAGIGENLGKSLGLPVFLYERSATDERRRDLAEVRRLRNAGTDADLRNALSPDFGSRRFHPTAGAVAVGARDPLIAYNVNLETSDVSAAKDIAASLRKRRDSGLGMAGVKALAIYLESRSVAQVSTNITRPDVCRPREVFDAVRRLSGELGVALRESELIGIVSRDHLSLEDVSHMRFAGLRETQFLEYWGQRYSAECKES